MAPFVYFGEEIWVAYASLVAAVKRVMHPCVVPLNYSTPLRHPLPHPLSHVRERGALSHHTAEFLLSY